MSKKNLRFTQRYGIDDICIEKIDAKCQPTHYSELDPRTMKIQNLRDELTVRGLSPKGLKPQLIARLAKALNGERLLDESKDDSSNQDADMDNSVEENAAAEGEDGEGFEDAAEVDMNDIVVLDEYDATKGDETKSEKKESVKAFDEKERRQLERRYTLPEAPQLIVHPSKVAKSGKFDCAVQSLSVLLDYRQEDSKEHSFEVSLFAELFNEMLMRDFGFNIYKELALLPDKPKENKEESAATKKKEESGENNSAATEAEKETVEKSSKDADNKNESDKLKEKPSSTSDKADKKSAIKDRRSSAKRPHEEESDDDGVSMQSGERKRRAKTMVAKPDLLLSFAYFDTTHCRYIFEKDMEELFYIIGLDLSRAQVRKLLAKVVTRDAFYYRKLTDKPKEESVGEETKTEAVETIDKSELVLAKGNKSLLPVFKTPGGSRKNGSGDAAVETTTGMVSYNGSLIDIGKLIEQMKRSERGREETEVLLNDLRKQNAELQSSQTRSTTKIKDLQSDVKSLTRKLSDSELTLSSFTRKNNDYYNILSSIYDRVSPLFNRIKDREKDRERDRDRRDRGDKDKDESKDSKDAKPNPKDQKETKEEKTEESKSQDTNKTNETDKNDKNDKSDTNSEDPKNTDSVEDDKTEDTAVILDDDIEIVEVAPTTGSGGKKPEMSQKSKK